MIDCLFCNIASGDVPTTLLYSDEDAVAFSDIQPQAPTHILVIPRRHIASYTAASESDELLLGKLARVAAEVAHRSGIDESGFRVVVNNGPDAQQSVQHLHLHVLGGRSMGWPPG